MRSLLGCRRAPAGAGAAVSTGLAALAACAVLADPAGGATPVSVIEPAPVNPVIEAEWNAHVSEWEQRGRLALPVQGSEVRLTPGLEGGWVGFCLLVRASTFHFARCPVAPRSEEIAYESWQAGGSGTRGLALVSGTAEAVAVNEASTSTQTVAVSGLAGLSTALVEISAPFPAASGWFDEFDPVRHGLRLSGGRGFTAPQRAYSASLAASGWQSPAAPPAGACSLIAGRLKGLHALFGHVVTSLPATPGIVGGGFASCVDIEYSYAGSSFDAALLLSAAAPGSAEPPALPGATPVARHPGLVNAPGWDGQILARRVGDAWLAVEGGASVHRRMQLLSHLRGRVG